MKTITVKGKPKECTRIGDVLRCDNGVEVRLKPLLVESGVFRSLTLLEIATLSFTDGSWHLNGSPLPPLESDFPDWNEGRTIEVGDGEESQVFMRHELREALAALDQNQVADVVGVAWVEEWREHTPASTGLEFSEFEETHKKVQEIGKSLKVEESAIQRGFAYAHVAQCLKHQLRLAITGPTDVTEPARGYPAYTVYKPILLSEFSTSNGLENPTCGRVAWRNDFQDIWISDKPFDLRLRQGARYCIKFLVESKALDADSAKSFRQEIDPYVRKNVLDLQPSGSRRIQDYFSGPYRELCRTLICTATRTGRYFLKV